MAAWALGVAPLVLAQETALQRVANGSGNPTDLDHYLAVYLSMLGFLAVVQIYLVRLPRPWRAPVGALITVGAVGWYWFGVPANILAWSLLGTLLVGLFFQYAPRGGGSWSSANSGGWGSDSGGGWSGGGGSSAGGGASGSW